MFTTDWFSGNIPDIRNTLNQFCTAKNANILEIGSWEGRSTLWFLENVPNSTITCVDSFEGGSEHQGMPELADVEKRFMHNITPYRNRITVAKGKSNEMLFIVGNPQTFDIIYVDGSHASWDALTDIVISFQLLKVGGIMLIDDYMGGYIWDPEKIYSTSPKPAVDAFIDIMSPHIRILHKEYQVHIQRLS